MSLTPTPAHRQPLPTERITCRYHSLVAIELNGIATHASRVLNRQVLYNAKRARWSIPFFIPNVSIASVRLSILHYSDKSLLGYEMVLRLPCTLEDLQLLQVIAAYIKTKCSEGGQHGQVAFDRCLYHPGAYPAYMEADAAINWHQLMHPFFNSCYGDETYRFTVDNGKLLFQFAATRFRHLGDSVQLKNKIITAVQQYIWQPLYTDVDDSYFFTTVKKPNGAETNQFINFVCWHNLSPVTWRDDSYLLIEVDKEWKAVKSKKWMPLLKPFFHQCDDEQTNLLPVLPPHIYRALKKALYSVACSLLLSFVNIEGERKELNAVAP